MTSYWVNDLTFGRVSERYSWLTGILERSSHFETEAVDAIENRKLNDGASYATCSHNRPPPQSQSEVANSNSNRSCRCYYAFIKPILQQIHYEISENCKTFKKIVDSKYFGHGIMIAILINTSSMGIGTVTATFFAFDALTSIYRRVFKLMLAQWHSQPIK